MSEIIVDSFAGGGGASTGIELALGRSPDIAINHDAVALAMHEVNHPDTQHLTADIWSVDPREACGGRPVGLLWASPDCKHFSKAKGGKPVEKNIRSLAWVVVHWANTVAPRVIILENVEEFSTWGPLGDDGRPCPLQKGVTFKRWAGELERLGYKVEWRELRACDYGAPTIRKRLFLIARRDGAPIVWPKPTHGDPKSDAVKQGQLKPWRTAAEIIDWSLPCPSIFDSSEEIMAKYGLRAVRPLQAATMGRIAKGVKRYVLDAAKPFIVNLTHHGAGQTQATDDPLATVTAAHRGEKAVVTPFATGVFGEPRVRAVDIPMGAPVAGGLRVVAPHLMTMRNAQKPFNEADKPAHTITSGGAHMHLVAAFMAQHNYLEPGHDVREPVSTIVGKGSTQGLAAVNLLRQFGTGVGSSLEDPARTVMADGQGKTQLSAAFLQKYYGADQDPRLDESLHTVTTKDRFGLVTVNINGEPYVITDIGMRMLTPRELFRAQGFPDDYVIDRKPDGSPITKTDQVSKCGNSVCPPMAEALVAANVPELSARRAAA
jgi:DNA (cytosine-5)-methyltransferase 1